MSTSATRFKYYSIRIRVMTQRFKIFISPTYKLIMFAWMWLQRIWCEREDEACLFFFCFNPCETLCAVSVPSPKCQKDWEWFLTFCNSWKCFLRSLLYFFVGKGFAFRFLSCHGVSLNLIEISPFSPSILLSYKSLIVLVHTMLNRILERPKKKAISTRKLAFFCFGMPSRN